MTWTLARAVARACLALSPALAPALAAQQAPVLYCPGGPRTTDSADVGVHLAAYPAGRDLAARRLSREERDRLGRLLDAVRSAFRPPADIVLSRGGWRYVPPDTTARSEGLGVPHLEATLTAAPAPDGDSVLVAVPEGSVAPALDSAILLAVRQALPAGAAVREGLPDSIRVAIHLDPAFDSLAVALPLTRVRLPVYRLTPVVPSPLNAAHAPRYPREQRRAGRERGVLLQFIVDEQGRPDPATVKVLRGTYDEFVEAILDVLPRWRYTPATANGCAYRQLVQQPFEFRVER